MAEETDPVEFLPVHPARTELEQLTDALAAGLITPELFALAKEKLGHAAPTLPPVTEPTPAAEPAAYASGELPPLASFFAEPVPLAAPAPGLGPAAVPPFGAAEAAPAPAQNLAPKTPLRAPMHALAAEAAGASQPPLPIIPPVANSPKVYDELLTSPAQSLASDMKPIASLEASEGGRGATWLKVVLVLVIVGVLWLIYQQVAGSHPDEQLTSPRPASTTTTAAPVSKARRPHRHAAKHTASKRANVLKPASSPKPAAAVRPPTRPTPKASLTSLPAKALAATAAPPAPVGTPPEPMPQPVAAAPEATDTEGATRVRAALAAYYADMLAPPFAAAQHFAPHVERLYIQQNLTPTEIDANFARSFFPDNQQAVLWVEPGTLRVSPPVADGSRVATFIEASRIYHPSRRGYQRLRAQVRARFTADYQIKYLRQERLLESTFE